MRNFSFCLFSGGSRLNGELFTGFYNEAVERLQRMWTYPGHGLKDFLNSDDLEDEGCFRGSVGGLSIALALSLPAAMHKDFFVVITYIVVLFSILVQGITIGRFAARIGK